jgi:threonine dehydratase
MITRNDVGAAAARIAGYIRVTPVLEADSPAGPVWLKLEQLQHTGSFKVRGAFNRILASRDELPPAGVVAASGGNAGLAVAYAAARYDVPARVYVPATAPPVKVARLRGYGAEVVLAGERYADAYEGERVAVVLCGANTDPATLGG